MALEYSDLTGSTDRTNRYRAQRYRSRELSETFVPRLEVPLEDAVLYDVSATGASFGARTNKVLKAGAQLPLRLMIGDVAAFTANSEVVRQEDTSGATKVAVRFLDHLFEIDHLRTVAQQIHYQNALAIGIRAYDDVPHEYRVVCEQVALFLNHWRETLGNQEDRLRSRNAPQDEIYAAGNDAVPIMRAEWETIRLEACDVSNNIVEDSTAFRSSRRYSQIQITPLLKPSPFLWRCYEKPRGYPGDFLLMSWIYDQPSLAKSLFGQALDRLGFEERLAATVPLRKSVLKGFLRDAATRKQEGDTVRVLNIGAGPAREIEEFLLETPSLPSFNFVLVDQDEDALACAHDRVKRAALNHGRHIQVDCRYLSFRQLFRNRDLLDSLANQDLVYSAGLFDYLPHNIGEDILRNCARVLAPDGLVAVGNAARGHDVRWVPEFLLDWHMIYRTESDMRRLASGVDIEGTLSIVQDSSRSWHFLILQRDGTGSRG